MNLNSPLLGQKMNFICVAKIKSSIKNHSCFNYKYRVGEALKCIKDPEKKQNFHVTSLNKKQEKQKTKKGRKAKKKKKKKKTDRKKGFFDL